MAMTTTDKSHGCICLSSSWAHDCNNSKHLPWWVPLPVDNIACTTKKEVKRHSKTKKEYVHMIFCCYEIHKFCHDSSPLCGLMLNHLCGDVHQMLLELVQIFLIQQLQDTKHIKAAVVYSFLFLLKFFFFLNCVARAFKYCTSSCQHITSS